MASEIKSDKLSPSTGTALQIGDASDTITIPTGATFTVTDGIGVASGGTGLASFTAGDILYATGSTTLAKLSKGTAEQVLAMNSGATAPDWGSVDLTVLPTITVGKGGTNIASFTAGDILYATGSTTLAKLAKGTTLQHLRMNSAATAPEWTAAPSAGGLIQCKQTVKTTVTSQLGAAGTWYDISGMAVSITPTLSTSKILIQFDAKIFMSQSGWQIALRLMRDTTPIYISTDALSSQLETTVSSMRYNTQNVMTTGCMFLDDPASTSAISYNLEWAIEATAYGYLNRTGDDTDNVNRGHNASSITAMEIAVGAL